jgi:serine/threonine protein kinase
MSNGAEQALESGGGATMNVPETEEAALKGTTLDGAYRITRLLAKGGMSAVYEAIQVRLNQRVAVKVMARELAVNPEALARFRREAEITSRLRHPHLVTVMDFGTAPAGQPYLVMEYLEGIDLDRRIRARGRLPLPAVVHITRQVASALAAAHDQGIVHRDLKPANVFLLELPGEPDFAKILDFGISKMKAASTQLTKGSAVIGTPNYMAPEQATGMLDDIDHRTDQWALACIAWEMLSGRTPFASDDMSAVFYQVIHLEPPPLGKRVPDLPAAVETVLRRALSKTVADRFPSIRDFANALASAACGQPDEATRTGIGQARSGPDGAAWVERRQPLPRSPTMSLHAWWALASDGSASGSTPSQPSRSASSSGRYSRCAGTPRRRPPGSLCRPPQPSPRLPHRYHPLRPSRPRKPRALRLQPRASCGPRTPASTMHRPSLRSAPANGDQPPDQRSSAISPIPSHFAPRPTLRPRRYDRSMIWSTRSNRPALSPSPPCAALASPAPPPSIRLGLRPTQRSIWLVACEKCGLDCTPLLAGQVPRAVAPSLPARQLGINECLGRCTSSRSRCSRACLWGRPQHPLAPS